AAGRAATAAACPPHAVVTRVPPRGAPRRYRPPPRRRGRPERASRALPRIGPAPNTAGRGRGRHNGAGRDDAVPRAGATDLRSPWRPPVSRSRTALRTALHTASQRGAPGRPVARRRGRRPGWPGGGEPSTLRPARFHGVNRPNSGTAGGPGSDRY